jgi:hypothetical protein
LSARSAKSLITYSVRLKKKKKKKEEREEKKAGREEERMETSDKE